MRYIFTLLIMLFLFPFSGHSQLKRLKEGHVLYEKYHYIDAQAVYEQVVKKGYKSADIYGDLADSYYYQSKYLEASKWYNLLFEEYPDAVTEKQYLRTIQSLKSNKEYDKAKALLDSYSAKFGKSIVAKIYDADPNYLESIENFESTYAIEVLGINTEGSDHSPSFLGETHIVFASSDRKETSESHEWDDSAYLDLFVSIRDTTTGRLREKQPIKGNINSVLHESAAVFTKDGKTMYFTRNNIKNGKRFRDAEHVIRVRIFKAELQEDESWKVVEDLAINDDNFSTGFPALNNAEDKLYFSSDRKGSVGMSDIWFIDIHEDGTYGYPVHLGNTINTEGREAFLYIDENDVLYFASDGHLGLGGLDIFKTKLNSRGNPTSIHNIGEPFNSPQDDFGYIIDLKRDVGYFTSNRDEGGSANDEIYYFFPECIIQIDGTLRDKETLKPLAGGTVKLRDEENNLIDEIKVGQDGKFSFEGECSTTYFLEGDKVDYLPDEISLKTPEIPGIVTQNIDLEALPEMNPLDLKDLLSLNPIYFAFDDHTILPQAELELSKVAEALKMYEKLVVHIESHADSRGAAKYNMDLSERRAQSTMKWLVAQGIDPSRLTAKGYGQTQLVNHCTKGVECSEEEHLLNRRSNFIIQE